MKHQSYPYWRPFAIAFVALMAACAKPTLDTPDQRIAPTVLYNDIWATNFADPGQVSDQEPGDDQTRQLPARKTEGIIANSMLHVATIKSYRYDASGNLTGYWMEADTTIHATFGGMDTVLNLGKCRFKAGLLSYPSTVGYKQWHTAELKVVRPAAIRQVMGQSCGIYRVGDQLVVRCDIGPDGNISKVWIESP